MILWIYLILVNILGFAVMGMDKKKAAEGEFRVKEGTLFFIAVIGGSLGSIAGMWFFRHKTRHQYFVFGMPAILVFQLLLALWIAM